MRTEVLTGATWQPLHAAEAFDWAELVRLTDEIGVYAVRRTYACGLVREYHPCR